jgi:hypothetical protein
MMETQLHAQELSMQSWREVMLRAPAGTMLTALTGKQLPLTGTATVMHPQLHKALPERPVIQIKKRVREAAVAVEVKRKGMVI